MSEETVQKPWVGSILEAVGQGRRLLVKGRPGSGKTALVVAIHDWARRNNKQCVSFAMEASSAVKSRSLALYNSNQVSPLAECILKATKAALLQKEQPSHIATSGYPVGPDIVCVDDLLEGGAAGVQVVHSLLSCLSQLNPEIAIVVTADTRGLDPVASCNMASLIRQHQQHSTSASQSESASADSMYKQPIEGAMAVIQPASYDKTVDLDETSETGRQPDIINLSMLHALVYGTTSTKARIVAEARSHYNEGQIYDESMFAEASAAQEGASSSVCIPHACVLIFRSDTACKQVEAKLWKCIRCTLVGASPLIQSVIRTLGSVLCLSDTDTDPSEAFAHRSGRSLSDFSPVPDQRWLHALDSVMSIAEHKGVRASDGTEITVPSGTTGHIISLQLLQVVCSDAALQWLFAQPCLGSVHGPSVGCSVYVSWHIPAQGCSAFARGDISSQLTDERAARLFVCPSCVITPLQDKTFHVTTLQKKENNMVRTIRCVTACDAAIRSSARGP